MNLTRHLRQTLTVARRDFVATVFTPTFLIFLLAPLIMASFGAIGGLGAATMADRDGDTARIVIIADADQAPAIAAADRQLRALFSPTDEDRPPRLRIDSPEADPAGQARRLFESSIVDIDAVLYGSLEAPEILYGPRAKRTAEYLEQLAELTLRAQRIGSADPLSAATKTPVERQQTSIAGQSQVAFLSVLALFFVTLMLSGQAVGTMAEERSNKVIEVLAAAVPLESVFLGKLIGMFGVALLFLAFWGTLLANLTAFIPPDFERALSDVGPAVGFPAFPLLFMVYFALAYMLLGAVFLSIGAQASTQRELQMMSLPITIVQMAMFGLAAAGAAAPDSVVATIAEAFPFSSPFAMIGRAANSPELWRHWLAIAWQLLWVTLCVSVGARWFRRGVLKSGPGRRRKRRRRESAVDISVS
ncbi:ABC transporter permease [Sphingosinithalassobacter sp. LHW66-3]|uniref:ABC transporter permease n=1 Tax=Sphingosinithalassobacter sp. LHW66-3 TaxID=3424718 RepID=UPI003D6A5528